MSELSFVGWNSPSRVEWGDGPDAPRNEPDNANNSRPVYQKIAKKFRLIIISSLPPYFPMSPSVAILGVSISQLIIYGRATCVFFVSFFHSFRRFLSSLSLIDLDIIQLSKKIAILLSSSSSSDMISFLLLLLLLLLFVEKSCFETLTKKW